MLEAVPAQGVAQRTSEARRRAILDIPWGKASILAWLASRVQAATVPPLKVLPVRHSKAQLRDFIQACQGDWGHAPLAVRSAAATEDAHEASHAGRYVSLLDVPAHQLDEAICRVAQALPGDALDGVMVQPMVRPVHVAGVAATHRVSDGAPWYCIDLAQHDAAAVTAGRACTRQLAIARSAATEGASSLEKLPPEALLALRALQEVEQLVGTVPVEIEFVIQADRRQALTAFVLQARPIAAARQWRFRQTSSSVRLDHLQQPDPIPSVLGRRTLLSSMSDWNPAELLGVHPRPLSVSLFNAVIGHGVWWQARARLGYTQMPLQTVALLQSVAGRAMVDVRRSANSLLPAGMSPAGTARLLDSWLDRLEADPALHDKVEFAVFRTATDFVMDARDSSSQALSRNEWADWQAKLLRLTRHVMKLEPSGPLPGAVARLARLLEETPVGTWQELLSESRVGTLAFAMLARAAFIGEAQLRSAVSRDALDPQRAEALRAAARHDTAWRGLLPPHGTATEDRAHLRPSSFDIRQQTWGQRGLVAGTSHMAAPPFEWSRGERRAVTQLLHEAGLEPDAEAWLRFVQFGASAREWAKFVFMRHLASAMADIEASMHQVGLNAETASWLRLSHLRGGLLLAPTVRERLWHRAAEQAMHEHQAQAGLLVGPIVIGPDSLAVVDSLGVLPNFVGHAQAEGPVVILGPGSMPESRLHGCIVVLECADPGFDWIFEAGIAGLVTAWGGANSHLAIRCAETGLAAAIGCGESVYAQVLRAKRARIDPTEGGLWLT